MKNLTNIKDLDNMTGFTLVSNDDYKTLIERNQKLLQQSFELGGMCTEIQQLKTALLEAHFQIEITKFRTFTLEELLKINSGLFAFGDVEMLFKLGFTYDELAEFITKKKNNLLMKEKEQTEDGRTENN